MLASIFDLTSFVKGSPPSKGLAKFDNFLPFINFSSKNPSYILVGAIA